MSARLGSTPCLSRTSTTLLWPFWLAMKSGVTPSCKKVKGYIISMYMYICEVTTCSVLQITIESDVEVIIIARTLMKCMSLSIKG